MTTEIPKDTDERLQLGIVGLGKMGANLSLQALEKGIAVSGNDTRGIPEELTQAGMTGVDSLDGFAKTLSSPRIMIVLVPAGRTVDEVLDGLAASLDPGDVLVDAGNSYWGDSISRHRKYTDAGFHFVDLGTSGGIEGARNGACFMAGGDSVAVGIVEPVLRKLAVPGGFVHAGPPGAGHFVKLVHNGIEFGMLQAIGEGMDLLEHYPEKLDVLKILGCWSHGSVIRSWLIELMEREFGEKRGLDDIPAYVEDTGEVNWLVSDALRMEVSIPAISLSVMELVASRDSRRTWARAIAMMRHGFGGHPFGPDAAIAEERRHGRIG